MRNGMRILFDVDRQFRRSIIVQNGKVIVMSKNAICKKELDETNGSVTLVFNGGDTLAAGLDQLSADMVRRLALHGLTQKLGDSYAGADTVAEAEQKANDVWAGLLANAWSVKRNATGGINAEAVARVTGKDITDVRDMIAGLDDKTKKVLFKDPRVVKAAAEIKLERLQGQDTSGAMDLGGLFSED